MINFFIYSTLLTILNYLIGKQIYPFVHFMRAYAVSVKILVKGGSPNILKYVIDLIKLCNAETKFHKAILLAYS